MIISKKRQYQDRASIRVLHRKYGNDEDRKQPQQNRIASFL